jgi:uncharacterized coiled-coil protein SlyX
MLRHLLAALAVACNLLLPVLPASAAVITVDPSTYVAAPFLQAGDELRLAPGTYAGFTTKNVKVWDRARPIVVTSADPARPAVLTDFILREAQGLVFRDVALNTTKTETRTYGFIVGDSKTVGFERVKVHGSLDGNPANDPIGLQLRTVEDVWVRDSEFTELNRGLNIGGATKVRVSGNLFHQLRSDGVDFAQVSDVQVVGNRFRNIYRDPLDHPDAIQFWTSGTTGAGSSDVLIAQNIIERGDGGPIQGIFIRDEAALRYERFTIADNLVVGTGWNALRVVGNPNAPSRDFTVRNNVLVTYDALEGVPTKELLTYILLQNLDGATVTGNRAAQISFDHVTNLVDSGNTITAPVADLGFAAKTAWLAALEPAPPVEADPRDARIAALEAQVATLTARVDALTAQLTAAQAERNALAARIDALLIERGKALSLAKQARAAKAKNQYLDPIIALLSAPAP